MFERPASRLYRNREMGIWLGRVLRDWEKRFREEELIYGRRLYKHGAVRSIELNATEAVSSFKLPDDSEPYCVVDFEDGEFVHRSSQGDDFLEGALAVATMYEAEELVADFFSSDESLSFDEISDVSEAKRIEAEENSFGDSESEKTASDTETSGDEGDSDIEKTAEPAEVRSEYPKLALSFGSRRKGLAFGVSWEFEDGKCKKAFGDKCLPIADLGDVQKENLVRLATLARKSGFKYETDCYILAEISKIPLFMESALEEWKKYFKIKLDDNVKLLALGEREVRLRPSARITESGGFDVQWAPTVDGEIVDADEFSKLMGGGISALKILPRYGILKVSSDDTSFVKNVERAREFGFADGAIPKYMLLSLSDFGAKMSMSDDLKGWMESLTSSKNPDEQSRLPEYLRKYQKRGVEWVRRLFMHDCNALIADEMGLGKTLQTLTLVNLSQSDGAGAEGKKYFVVCPASVIPVWIGEAQKFFPSMKCAVFASDSDISQADVWISSYTQLRRNRAVVEKCNFEIAVLDEAQFIKNPDAKTTGACMALKAKRKIALTGTPVENRLLDMWTTFRWLMPGLMGQRTQFEASIESDENFVKSVRRQISPFVLRRVKSDVATELPEKIYVNLACPMSQQQKSEYQKLLTQARDTIGGVRAEDAKARFTVLSLLTRLRQAACDASLLPWVGADGSTEDGGKISVLVDKAEELCLGGKKILVFSQFTRFLDLIYSRLAAKIPDSPIFTLTGSTRDRSKPVEEFQSATGAAIMLVSLRAGGTGITLTSADYVFLADPWWNPAVEEQAVDRVHRIGRKGDVFVYRMIAQDTVEDRVRKLQEQKRRLFNDLLGGLKDVSNNVKFIETVSDILS